MATSRVSPGQWVRVRISDAMSATMQIGDTEPVPAFIEHVRDGRRITTYAQIRCPNLRPGSYAATARTADETVQVPIQIV